MADNEREELRRLNLRLKEKVLRHAGGSGISATAVDGLAVSKREGGGELENCFYTPRAGVVLQGHKRSRIGSAEYRYGEFQCIVVALDLPGTFDLTDASVEKPFLAVSLELDRYLITQLSAEVHPSLRPHSTGRSYRGVAVADVQLSVLDAFSRLVDLLDHPAQIPVLAPIIKRELHYRLLLGPHGDCLLTINTLGTQSNQVAQAVTWLREHYRRPLLIEELAGKVNMAPSTFHRHFKLVTTLSPVQFQKRLRLHEAQRLMLTGKDANYAALDVGYESVSQFNREYKRMFGEPPFRDISRLRVSESLPEVLV